MKPTLAPKSGSGLVSPLRGRTFPVEVLSTADIQAILRACNRGPSGQRNTALIVLLWRTGLRISEALALRPCDIDFDRGTVHVLHGKGDKPRLINADDQTLNTLRRLAAQNLLFQTITGQPLSASYVRALLPRLARIAGIEKRVHAHALRHTNAYDMLSEGIRIDTIQKQLGHSKLAVTARYLEHIPSPDVARVIRARVWPEGVAVPG